MRSSRFLTVFWPADSCSFWLQVHMCFRKEVKKWVHRHGFNVENSSELRVTDRCATATSAIMHDVNPRFKSEFYFIVADVTSIQSKDLKMLVVISTTRCNTTYISISQLNYMTAFVVLLVILSEKMRRIREGITRRSTQIQCNAASGVHSYRFCSGKLKTQ